MNDNKRKLIEIAAGVVWRVENAAQAVFGGENYVAHVRAQSEIAVWQPPNAYAYDHGEEHEVVIRIGIKQVSAALARELQDRLHKACLVVEEARLSQLAYVPEIAGAMLRRQQANAIIAARETIVHGAVGMVQMPLDELAAKRVVERDNGRKAPMVSNLLVVLCRKVETQPVINTGTLYA